MQQLASRAPAELWAQIAPRRDAVRPPCHGCGTPLDRDLRAARRAIGPTTSRAPTCDELMTRRPHQGDCTRRVPALSRHLVRSPRTGGALEAEPRRGGAPPRPGTDTLAVGGDVLMDAMIWTPGLVLHGAAGAAQVGGAAIEVVGTAAEGVFGAVLDIISSLFE